MIHKLAHVADLEKIAIADTALKEYLHTLLQFFDNEYGTDRNVDDSDGGYVLYCEPGTTKKELKTLFNYSAYTVEEVTLYSDNSPPFLSALYLLNNEFSVTIVISPIDAPAEIIEAFENGY